MTDARQISTTFRKSACRITKYVRWNVLIIKSNYKTHLPKHLFHKILSWLTEIVLQNRRKWKAVIMAMKLLKLKIISLLLLWTVFLNLEKYFVYELRSGNHLQRTNPQTVRFGSKSKHVRGEGEVGGGSVVGVTRDLYYVTLPQKIAKSAAWGYQSYNSAVTASSRWPSWHLYWSYTSN